MYTMSTSYHHDPAYRATEKPKDRSHLSFGNACGVRRKRGSRPVCLARRHSVLRERAGRGSQRSSNIQDVSKPGATAIGFSGAHPGKTSLGWSGRRWRSPPPTRARTTTTTLLVVLGGGRGGLVRSPPKKYFVLCFKYWCLKNTKSVVSIIVSTVVEICRFMEDLFSICNPSSRQLEPIIYQVRKFSTY